MIQTNKIGFLGGTFDPIHFGHLTLAESVREAYGLDRIIFIPARKQPFKIKRLITDSSHRLEMVKLAISNNPFFEVSDFELRQKGISYTVDTMSEFKNQYPNEQFKLYFLLGGDNLKQFHQWKEPHKLLNLCTFIVFGRPGFQLDLDDPLTSSFELFKTKLIGISSTDIRNRVFAGKTIRYLVPEVVRKYIEDHNLYIKF